MYAKGKAKTLSWNLIASRKSGTLRMMFWFVFAAVVRIRTPSTCGQPASLSPLTLRYLGATPWNDRR